MINGKTLEGAYILWRWGDEDIENPRRLRQQLQQIVDQGFSHVFCELRATRYDIFDHQVVRTVTQVSQWAQSRKIKFWFNADPRMASRTLIGKTEERIQYLIVHPKSKSDFLQPQHIIRKIIHNQITLRYYYPRQKLTHSIPEVSLSFDPIALEKAFIFQIEENQIVHETIKDVTSHVHFFVNIAKHYVEVYGKIKVPEDETWWAMAFPKYNINLIDYTSRENNDLLYKYIENLFDEGAYIDGIFWQDPGYILDPWQFPVSECIYNSFLAEKGYKIKDKIYALVLPVDDKSHIKIRYDYHTFINSTIYDAGKDLSKVSKSFLGNVDFTISHNHQNPNCRNQKTNLLQPSVWDGLNIYSQCVEHLGPIKNTLNWIHNILPDLIEIKSRSIFSSTQDAASSAWFEDQAQKKLNILADIMTLYSVRWCASSYGYSGYIGEKDCLEPEFPKHASWNFLRAINQRIHDIYNITGFILPDANVALVYPSELLKTADPEYAKKIKLNIRKLILQLTLNQIQVDVISSELLLEGKFTSEGLRIRHRHYKQLLFPLAKIISPQMPSMISAMADLKFPFYFIGSYPENFTNGKPVSQKLKDQIVLYPENEDIVTTCGLSPIFTYPENSLATMIRIMDGELFLIMPMDPIKKTEGKIGYKSLEFNVEPTNKLTIYSHWGRGKVQKIYS